MGKKKFKNGYVYFNKICTKVRLCNSVGPEYLIKFSKSERERERIRPLHE